MRQRLPIALAALLSIMPTASFAASPGMIENGVASFYHDSLHGNRTASGQVYDKRRMTAAHKTLPLGSRVRVTDLATGNSVVVRVNDRGPFVRGRIIDLSRQAATELNMIRRGITRVEVKVLSVPSRES